MRKLQKINERFYQYEEAGKLFVLSLNARGIDGIGKSWFFKMIYQGTEQIIATFCVKPDGYGCEKKDYKGRLWMLPELIPAAEQMMENMLSSSETKPSSEKRLRELLLTAMILHVDKEEQYDDCEETDIALWKTLWKNYFEELGTSFEELTSLGIGIHFTTDAGHRDVESIL